MPLELLDVDGAGAVEVELGGGGGGNAPAELLDEVLIAAVEELSATAGVPPPPL